LDLDGEIDTLKSSAAVGDGKVVYTLIKRTLGIWTNIKYEGKDRLERRQIAQDEYYEEMENVGLSLQ
jgi:hypothetical protein